MIKISSPVSILELGSASIKFCIYDNIISNQNLFYEAKTDFTRIKNFLDDKPLANIISKAEKDLDKHLNELYLAIDCSSIHSLDISIQKNYDKKIFTETDLNYLINQCKQLITVHNKDKNILHTIVSQINLDGKIFESIKDISQETYKATLEIKFIIIKKKKYEEIKKIFIKKHIVPKEIYCASYLKALGIIKKIDTSGFTSFIDIGLNKSSLSIFKNKKFLYINNIHIGGEHITKDISKVLNIDYRKAEAEKLKFSKNEKLEINNFKDKELLKNIINSRLEEIVELLFFDCPLLKNNIFNNDLRLFFMGNGSKVLNENMLSFGSDFNFINEMTIIEESKKDCCDSFIKFKATSENIQPRESNVSLENKGFFERLFEYFSKN